MRACVRACVYGWVGDLGREGWKKGRREEKREGGRGGREKEDGWRKRMDGERGWMEKEDGWRKRMDGERGGKDRAINRVNEYMCVGNLA